MSKLPNGDRAIVELSKLRDYILSPSHRLGRHKARVFRAALGLGPENAGALRDALLHAARTKPADPGPVDEYGARFMVEFTMHHAGRTAAIRCLWIIRANDSVPRFVTAFVLRKPDG